MLNPFTRWSMVLGVVATACLSLFAAPSADSLLSDPASLRKAYSVEPSGWPVASWDEAVLPADRRELAPVPDVVYPADNPYSKDKADLGKQLFWDARLSGNNAMACVSCHHPDLGWADGKTTSLGHQVTALERNAPTILGVAFQKRLMWDARATSLEDQALLPLANQKEMHAEFAHVEQRLNAIPGYRESFKKVFGTDTISIDQVAKALATFQRTVVPGKSKFDAFLAGRSDALDDQQLRGLHLFRTQARCINCHNGPILSDGMMHNIGLTNYGRPFEDLGQYKITKKPEDVGNFRTPTLRNVTRTAPYMHNGLMELDVLLQLYNSGMPNERVKDPNDPLAPKKSALLKKLNLSEQDKKDIAAFLMSLEEPRTRVRNPNLPGIEPTTQPAE